MIKDLFENYSSFAVTPFRVRDRHGADVLAVVAKMSWEATADDGVRALVPQRPVRDINVMHGDDPNSSVRYPSDAIDEKPGTDILLVGTAYPSPESREPYHVVKLTVHAEPAPIEKVVKVYGPRVYEQNGKGLKPTRATTPPTEPVPLQYERAFGGFDMAGDDFVRHDDNPAGRGMALDASALVGTFAHEIESANGSEPAGFGAISPDWAARRELAGTFDETWQRTRAPLLPDDFDPRFNCVAHPDLWSEAPLSGTEQVEVLGATPDGVWKFELPPYAPVFKYIIGGELHDVDTHLDTFLIDADERVIELTWRASIRLPLKLQALERVLIRADHDLPAAIAKQQAADHENTP